MPYCALRVAQVRQELPDLRFVACVNGEEDFMEEFGMEDEGNEWRKVSHQSARRSTALPSRFNRHRRVIRSPRKTSRECVRPMNAPRCGPVAPLA